MFFKNIWITHRDVSQPDDCLSTENYFELKNYIYRPNFVGEYKLDGLVGNEGLRSNYN